MINNIILSILFAIGCISAHADIFVPGANGNDDAPSSNQDTVIDISHACCLSTAQDLFLTRESIPERKTGPLKPGCGLEFEDTVMTDRGPSGQMISWGHTLRCALLSKRSLGLELSWTGSPRVKRANYREAHAALTLDEPAIESAETLVFKDLAERSGEWAAEENGQTTGKATLKMMRIPGLSQ